MKIAYILPINIEQYAGVLNKVHSQVSSWHKLGEEVCIFLITPNNNYSIKNTPLNELREEGKVKIFYTKGLGVMPWDLLKDWIGIKSTFSTALKAVAAFEPDLVYARSSLYQPFYRNLGSHHKLILEVNTGIKSEYKLQASQSFKYFLRYIYFRLTDKFYLNKVSGVVAVTKEIANIYQEKEVKVIPNAINVDNYPTFNRAGEKHRILFLGSPGMPWQGVDILVELARSMTDIKFDIVGFSANNFDSNTISKNVQFHGFLPKKEYLMLMKEATAMMGTLALYRKEMDEACPLKVREYLACCKPVILPYKDTAFEQKGYPEWVLQLPNNREGILQAKDKIRMFLKSCITFSIEKEDVKKYVHVDNIEKDRLQFFKSIVDEKQ